MFCIYLEKLFPAFRGLLFGHLSKVFKSDCFPKRKKLIDPSRTNDGSQHNGSIIADSRDLFEYGKFRKYLEVARPDLDLFLLGIPFQIRSLGEIPYSSQ